MNESIDIKKQFKRGLNVLTGYLSDRLYPVIDMKLEILHARTLPTDTVKRFSVVRSAEPYSPATIQANIMKKELDARKNMTDEQIEQRMSDGKKDYDKASGKIKAKIEKMGGYFNGINGWTLKVPLSVIADKKTQQYVRGYYKALAKKPVGTIDVDGYEIYIDQ